jgi:transcriptional accessory protein Tex/SPT6
VRVATASLNQRIADELGVPERQVSAAVGLLDGGATVPFVARYRKEATGGWTTRNCAPCRSGWTICASSRSAARRS